MIRRNKDPRSQYQTFPDGIGTSWRTQGRRLAGIRQQNIHYADATVGERRYFDAKVAGTVISKAVLVPYGALVDMGDIFVIGGTQYMVEQKDRKDTAPPSWLLSLVKPPVLYNLTENAQAPGSGSVGS